MSKPVEYRLPVAGFGIWRIVFEPPLRKWTLSYNVRASGAQWMKVGEFHLAETAALAVANRETGAAVWDGLRFTVGLTGDLTKWSSEQSEGVQPDAPDA